MVGFHIGHVRRFGYVKNKRLREDIAERVNLVLVYLLMCVTHCHIL